MERSPEYLAMLEKLLEAAIREASEMLDAHQQRVQFYSSLLSAMLAATVAGAMQAKEVIHYRLLLAGPVLVLVLSIIAMRGTFRFYRRFLEATTQRAKLEHALHLDEPIEDQKWWKGESLLATRHVKSREKYATSEAFVHQQRHLGYQADTRMLFSAFAAVGIYLAIFLVTGSKFLQ